MSILSERLTALRHERGLNQKQLSELTGITRSVLLYYERGERDPGTKELIKLARFFDVSTDYLLGLTDVRKPEKQSVGDELGLDDPSIDNLTALAGKDCLYTMRRLIGSKEFRSMVLRMHESVVVRAACNKLNIKAVMADKLKYDAIALFEMFINNVLYDGVYSNSIANAVESIVNNPDERSALEYFSVFKLEDSSNV